MNNFILLITKIEKMSCKKWAHDLYDRMGQGQINEVFEQYYADNVVVVEGDGTVRNGKDAQREALKGWLESVEEHHGGGYTAITADEENQVTMVETWGDVTFKGGHRWKMEEVAVQKWEDGQIVHERFYYNVPPGMEGQEG